MLYKNEPWYRPELGTSIRKHKSGHLIVKSGRFRDVSVHRAIVTLLLEETPSQVYGNTIPEGFIVHHMDFRPAHNCPHNFILMQPEFHAAAHSFPKLPNGRWARLRKKSIKLLPAPATLDIPSKV